MFGRQGCFFATREVSMIYYVYAGTCNLTPKCPVHVLCATSCVPELWWEVGIKVFVHLCYYDMLSLTCPRPFSSH